MRQRREKRLKKLAKKENKHPIRQDWYDRCPFLNNNNKCDIYSDRPLICREYTCYNYEHSIYNKEIFKGLSPKDFRLVDLRKEIFGKGK